MTMRVAFLTFLVFSVILASTGAHSSTPIYANGIAVHCVSSHGKAVGTAHPCPTATPNPSSTVLRAAVVASSPYAYWPMVKTSGTETDLGGGNNPLTYVGTGTRGGIGLVGDTGSSSYSPGGNSGNYAMAASPLNSWPSTNAFSGEAWIKPASGDCSAGFVRAGILSQMSPTGPGWFMNLQGDSANDGNCFFSGSIDGTNRSTVTADGSIVPGNIYYVVETFDKTTGEVIYVNGISKGTDSATYPTAWSATPGPIIVGQLGSKTVLNQVGSGFVFNGQISNVAVYSRVLSQAEVTAHYAAGTASGPATPTPSPSPAPTATPIAYDATSACINGKLFTNNVLPANVGEFSTHGLDDSYWGANHGRTLSPIDTWPGYQVSWGGHQYDTLFATPHDGLGANPFTVTTDVGAPGAPTALSISANPMPTALATNPAIMINDQYPVTTSGSFTVPANKGSITINVADPTKAQIGMNVGVGYNLPSPSNPFFVGKCVSGCNPTGHGTGGTNPWTIANINVYNGTPGATIPAPVQLRAYGFPDYVSGVLDTNVDQQDGFFVARVRLAPPQPGASEAFWMLATGGMGSNFGQIMRAEWDIQEKFANLYGYNQNSGYNIWNSGPQGSDNTQWFAYGCGLTCSPTNNTAQIGSTGVYPWPSTGNYSSDYHDYGYLIMPGGLPTFPADVTQPKPNGHVYVVNNPASGGTTFILDGQPVAGHIGGTDVTQGSTDKEVMLMFQVGNPGQWLDPNNQLKNDTWPQQYWVQWLRIYKPTATSC